MSAWTRIARGSARILGRLVRRLLAAGERDGDRIGPLLLLAIACAALWYVLERAPILGGPLTLGWLAAAWRAGAPAAAEAEEEQPEAPTVALPDRDELAVALHEIGAPHAHVAALADHLGLDPTRVREALAEAAIPVSGGCRMKGRGVSTGVKATDFPPLPSPTSDAVADVVAAGQDSNNNKRVRRWPWGHTVTDPAERLHHTVTKTT